MSGTKVALEIGSDGWHAWRKRACNDLFWLNAVVLGHREIIPMTYRAHYALCRFAERRTGIPAIDNARIQLIQIWRGAGKSTLITKGRSIQRLLQDRNYAIGIANEKQENANAFLGMIKAEFEQNDLLRALFPELIPDFKSTEWRSNRIVIERTRPNPVNPSVLATGIGGTVTGVHMNEWLVDDIISQDAAENARAGLFTEIEKANNWIIRLQPLLSRPKQDPITFIGTPWWIGDCYEFIEATFGRKEEPRIFKWNLKLPGGEMQTLQLEQKGELAIFRHYPIDEAGRAVWPEGGLTLEGLDQLREDDPTFYAAQYLMTPSAGEASDFDDAWIKEYEWESRSQIRYRGRDGRVAFVSVRELSTVLSVDPAISKKPGTARTALCVTGTNGREIFVLHAEAARLSPTEAATRIIELYRRFRPAAVIIEKVAYQEALKDVLTLVARQQGMNENLPVQDHTSGTDIKKDVRIKALETYFRRGLIYVHPRTQQELLDEYRNFPVYKYKDLLDALSFQRSWWDRLQAYGADDESTAARWRAHSRARAGALRDRYRRTRV